MSCPYVPLRRQRRDHLVEQTLRFYALDSARRPLQLSKVSILQAHANMDCGTPSVKPVHDFSAARSHGWVFSGGLCSFVRP